AATHPPTAGDGERGNSAPADSSYSCDRRWRPPCRSPPAWGPAPASSRARAFERRRESADEGSVGLEAGGEAQQVFRNRRRRALGTAAMLDDTLDASERCRALENLHRSRDRHRRPLATHHANRQHPTEATAHLTSCHVVSRMGRQTRIEDRGERGVFLELKSERQGGFRRATDSEEQGTHAALE